MEAYVAMAAGVLVVGILVTLFAPHWWIGVVVILTFSTTPSFVPQQVQIAGFGIFPHEIAFFIAAAYLLWARPPNKITDWCAAVVAIITAAGLVHGLFAGNDIAAIANDGRGLLSVALCVFIVGRIAFSEDAIIALRALQLTLWISFVFVCAGALNLLKLNARAEDASLIGKGMAATSDVTRVLSSTTHVAGAVVAISLGLWAIKPNLARQTIPYFLPASGITVLGFSRNGIVLIAATLILAPLFNWGSMKADGETRGGGLIRAVALVLVVVTAYFLVGALLYLSADYPGFSYLQSVYSAYSQRVVSGLDSGVRSLDSGVLYRQAEIVSLKRSIVGHEYFGNGFGFRYRHGSGRGFGSGSGTYFAHHFYWWAIAKIGWLGLIAYVATFATGIANSMFGPGRFPLRSAAGAAVVAMLLTSIAAPLSTVAAGPVFGVLLGIALLRANSRGALEEIFPSGQAFSKAY